MGSNSIDEMHISNAKALAELDKNELSANLGKYAIFHEGQLIDYFETNREALREAVQKFATGEFSVMRVETQPVELGVASCADYPG